MKQIKSGGLNTLEGFIKKKGDGLQTFHLLNTTGVFTQQSPIAIAITATAKIVGAETLTQKHSLDRIAFNDGNPNIADNAASAHSLDEAITNFIAGDKTPVFYLKPQEAEVTVARLATQGETTDPVTHIFVVAAKSVQLPAPLNTQKVLVAYNGDFKTQEMINSNMAIYEAGKISAQNSPAKTDEQHPSLVALQNDIASQQMHSSASNQFMTSGNDSDTMLDANTNIYSQHPEKKGVETDTQKPEAHLILRIFVEEPPAEPATDAQHNITTELQEGSAVIAADINHDGSADIVTADAATGHITFWNNSTHDGSHWTANDIVTSLTKPDFLVGIEMHDEFNQSRTDIIAADSTANKIVWLENSAGDGSHWVEHLVTDNFSVNSLYATDMNSDGTADIFAASTSANQIVHWQLDHDTFNQVNALAVEGASAVTSADINNDGKADIVAAGSAGINWWDETHNNQQTVIDANFTDVKAIVAADINNDGNIHVIAANNDTIAIWHQEDNGTNWIKTIIDQALSHITSLKIADMDNDGHLDTVASTANSANQQPNVLWWKNPGDNSAQWTSHTVNNNLSDIKSIATADVNNDQHIDVIAVNHDQAAVVVGA